MSEEKEEEKKTEIKKFKSLMRNPFFIFKITWFAVVLISFSVLVIINREMCMNFEKFSGYNVLFLVAIILLLYPFFNTIKISPTGGIEFTKSDMQNFMLDNKTDEAKFIAEMKNDWDNYLKKIPDMVEQIIANQQDGAPTIIGIDQLSDNMMRYDNEEQLSDDMPLHGRKKQLAVKRSASRKTESSSNNISFLENAETLKTRLDKKYENTIKNKYDKNSNCKILKEVYDTGIEMMVDTLEEDVFQLWIDDSKEIIEKVSKKTDIKLKENYDSLVDCLINTGLPPCHKLNTCIDYTLDIMKYMA